MPQPGSGPREGAITIVFDTPRHEVERVTGAVAAAGFAVRPYYPAGREDRPGGAPAGSVRMRAERPMLLFTQAEVDAAEAEFRPIVTDGLPIVVVGTETWQAGGGGSAGDREPRVPPVPPRAGSGEAHTPTA